VFQYANGFKDRRDLSAGQPAPAFPPVLDQFEVLTGGAGVARSKMDFGYLCIA
jgi:hypothetical protein